MEATELGNVRAVESLLANLANPNVHDDSGFTALMVAAEYNQWQAARLLLEFRADPCQLAPCEEGHYTAAMQASESGHFALAKFLSDAEDDLKRQRPSAAFPSFPGAGEPVVDNNAADNDVAWPDSGVDERGVPMAGPRRPCKWGQFCFNANPDHRAKFSHPFAQPACRNGATCTDTSDEHRANFHHPEGDEAPAPPQVELEEEESEESHQKAVVAYEASFRAAVVLELREWGVTWAALSWRDRRMALSEYARALSTPGSSPDFAFLAADGAGERKQATNRFCTRCGTKLKEGSALSLDSFQVIQKLLKRGHPVN